MERLSSLLPTALRKHGLLEHASASQIVVIANTWLQKNVPSSMSLTAIKYTDGVLFLSAATSTALHMGSQKRGELLEYLHISCAGIVLRDICCMHQA